VCYKSTDPVAYTRSKAIARLLINGTELCTGWRVGPRNRMLTNNHCFDNSADAYDTEVWFNYQCAVCRGYDTFRPTKVWGAQVLATNHVYDFTLFTVEDFAAVKKFGYLTLDTARPAKGQELFVPQHPAGEPTRIAGALGEKAGTCAVTDNAYDGYATDSDVAYYCDTAGGSSGSPVLSRRPGKGRGVAPLRRLSQLRRRGDLSRPSSPVTSSVGGVDQATDVRARTVPGWWFDAVLLAAFAALTYALARGLPARAGPAGGRLGRPAPAGCAVLAGPGAQLPGPGRPGPDAGDRLLAVTWRSGAARCGRCSCSSPRSC
jgi:hypothetical protein